MYARMIYYLSIYEIIYAIPDYQSFRKNKKIKKRSLTLDFVKLYKLYNNALLYALHSFLALIIQRKNDFAESKNLVRYRAKNNFVGL